VLRIPPKEIALLTGLLGLALVQASCNRGGASLGPQDLAKRPDSVFKVTYKNNTKVIDPGATARYLRAASRDGSVLIFDAADPRLASLIAGDVLLLQNVTLRKVLGVDRRGSEIAVRTTPAGLTDAVREADIRWKDARVSFSGASDLRHARIFQPLLRMGGNGNVVYAAEPSEISAELGDWKISAKAEPLPDRLNLNLDIEYEHGAGIITLKGDGYLQNFETVSTILVHDGILKYFDYQNKNINGEMLFEWGAGKNGDAELKDALFPLPDILAVPLPMGGIPFSLVLTGAVVVKPAMGSRQEVVHGKFKLKYNGVQGFSLTNKGLNGSPGMTGDATIETATNLSIEPHAFIAGFAMPRLELKLGGTENELLEKAMEAAEKGPDRDWLTQEENTLRGGTRAGDFHGPEHQIENRGWGHKAKIKMNEALLNNPLSALPEGTAYAEVVTVMAFQASGMSVPFPCQRTDLTILGKVGAEAKMWGVTLAEPEVEIFHKEQKKKIPPQIKCND
jgi:hypothetical protein